VREAIPQAPAPSRFSITLPVSFYVSKAGKIILITLGIVPALESKSIISFRENQA